MVDEVGAGGDASEERWVVVAGVVSQRLFGSCEIVRDEREERKEVGRRSQLECGFFRKQSRLLRVGGAVARRRSEDSSAKRETGKEDLIFPPR